MLMEILKNKKKDQKRAEERKVKMCRRERESVKIWKRENSLVCENETQYVKLLNALSTLSTMAMLLN